MRLFQISTEESHLCEFKRMKKSFDGSKPTICPYCNEDVFEFGNDNYCYDHDLAKTRGEVGLYIVHQDCFRNNKTTECKKCGTLPCTCQEQRMKAK